MLVGRRGVCAVKRLPGQLEPSSTGNRGRWMHRQRKHRTYGVSAVCRKSAGIEKHTGSDSARSIRIPNVEEAAVTEQLGETEPGQSALSFHRTGGETLDEAPLQKHEDHRDRDGRDDGGRHHVPPSSSTPRRGTSSQERRPASSNRAGRSRTVPALCAETLKISVRGSLKCWSEIQFDKRKYYTMPLDLSWLNWQV